MLRRAKRLAETFASLFKRHLALKYIWVEWVLPFEILNIIFAIAGWYFFAKVFGRESPFLKPYGGSFIAYLILGMGIYPFFNTVLNQPYSLINICYSSSFVAGGVRMGWADYLQLAGIPIPIYMASEMLITLFQHIITLGVYLFAGIFIFGMQMPGHPNYLAAFLAVFLGMLAVLGIGLISASMIWIAGAWHGEEPIQWAVSMLAGLISGVYFPPEVLPKPLLALSQFLPQTYALRIARLSILKGYSISQLSPDFLILLLFCVILLPLGIVILHYSLKLAKKRGSLMSF
jgi:ABC-type multidrug transport system permease subunit